MITRKQKILFISIILAGIALRFAWLDRKVYWYDETFTSLEVSGYSPGEAQADILTGRVASSADLEKYQFPRSNSIKTVRDTIHGLIANEPQLTPAYFVVLRWWSELFPNSITSVRALSAIFSVLALAAAFWFIREIFPESPRVAYVGTALLASSPFHVLYAQEARSYAMWSAVALSSTALLIWAMRRRGAIAWTIYGLCGALSLYTYLLSILVLAGHALFVAVESRFRITSTAKGFAAAWAAAVLAFLAWPYHGQSMGTGSDHYSIAKYALRGARNIGILFADFNLRNDSARSLLLPYALLLTALILMCGYAVYFLCRRANKSQAALILILMGSLILPLLILDLVKGSSQALVTRYMFPSLIALQLAVAYMLASKTQSSVIARSQMFWQIGLAALLALGLTSSAAMVHAEEWWNKDPNNDLFEASRVINGAQDPVVVISDTWFVPLLSLEHKLRPSILYQLTVYPKVPQIDPNARAVFTIRPSAHLRNELGRCYHWEAAYAPADLWSLSPKPCE